MNIAGLLLNMVKNFNPGNSVLAGGGAAVLIYAAGALAVAAGVALPPIGIGALTIIAAHTPLTMDLVGPAAIVIGHLVTSFVPDSVNQQINALAKKAMNTIPQIQQQFPIGKNGATDTGDITKAAAAVALITQHVTDEEFPTSKNGSTGSTEAMPAVDTNFNKG